MCADGIPDREKGGGRSEITRRALAWLAGSLSVLAAALLLYAAYVR